MTWRKPGATESDYNRDVTQCDYETASATATYGSGQPTARTNAGAIGQGFGIGMARAFERNDLMIRCMRARGWTGTRGEQPASIQGTAPVVAPAPPTPSEPPQSESKYLFTAQAWSRANGCLAPAASLSSKGAGFEVFTVRCGRSDPVTLRCEYGTCRPLQ